MNLKYTLIILFIAFIFTLALRAENDTLQRFPAQISFVYPLGTSGVESANYEFNFSLNVIMGVTGGIRGVECAGIMNTVNHNVLGAQCAGILNMTSGYFTGFQGAGIINITNKKFKGVQAAGITNIVNDDFIGVQAAGIANIVNGNSNGVQAAGIANIGNGDFVGVKAAGIINVTNGDQKGMQVAGIINQAHTLNGVQIGLINICDSLESGFPIGLINIIGEGGYHEWELSVADYANTRISFKSGVKDFYTIYTVGINLMEDKLFITGLGFGNIFELSPKFNLQPELIGLFYYAGYIDRNDYTGSTHLKLGLTYNITKRFGISVAPSLYVNISERDYPYDDVYKISSFKPFETYNYEHVRVDIGAGLSFAILYR